MNIRVVVLLVCLLTISNSIAWAIDSPSCEITTQSEITFLEESCFSILERASFSQASLTNALINDPDWRHLNPAHPFIIRTPNKPVWIRFALTNNAKDTHKRFLEFPDAHTSSIQLYSIAGNGYIYKHPSVGFDVAMSKRPYRYKNVLYDVAIPYGETQWFYARLESRYESSFVIRVVSDAYLMSYFLPEYYWLGIFYGILMIMAIYNVFIYISTKEKVYVFYVVYVLCCALYTGGEDTVLFQLFWPESPQFNHYLFVLSPPLLSLSYIFYATSFLEIKKDFRVVLYSLLGLTALAFILSLTAHTIGYKLSTVLFYIPFLIFYALAIYLYRQGKKFTRFFIIGSSFILISLTIFLLRKWNLLPSNIYTFYTFNFAFILEVILFSYALADKFKLMKKQKEETQLWLIDSMKEQEKLKDSVNRELEHKVKERTAQLEEQSQELAKKNEQLLIMASRLNEVNVQLDVDNWQLKKQVVEETKSRILFQEVSLESFKEIFPDELTCYRFLEELKWSNGFTCIRCGNSTYMHGDKAFARKCKKCKYNESVTANTLFQGIKFPVDKAFYITYRTFSDTDKLTVDELAHLVETRTATVWAFRKKVQEAKEEKNKKKIKVTSWEQLIR